MVLEYLPEQSEVDILGLVNFDLLLLRYHALDSTLSTFIKLELLLPDIFESVDGEHFQECDEFLIEITVFEGSYFLGQLLDSVQRHELGKLLDNVERCTDNVLVLLTRTDPQHFHDFNRKILFLDC